MTKGATKVELERRIGSHDERIQVIFEAIRQLMTPPGLRKRKIGSTVKERGSMAGVMAGVYHRILQVTGQEEVVYKKS